MDAEIITVDGRQYRKQAVIMSLYLGPQKRTKAPEDVQSKKPQNPEIAADNDEIDCTIKHTDGQYVIKMDVNPAFYKFLIGRNGETKKRLQTETGALISIPGKTDRHTEIVISAPFEKASMNARTKIQDILDQSLEKLDYNYFLSLPLNDPIVKGKMEQFTQSILQQNRHKYPNIEASSFSNPDTLHFTIIMLRLYSQDAIDRAKQHLASLQKEVYDLVGTRTTMAHLNGLVAMNGDASKANVLYTQPTPDTKDKIQQLANFVAASFVQAGIAAKVHDEVLLHCTLINTRFGTNGGPRKPVDASALLKDFAAFDFGEVRIPSIDLSQRGRYDSNGYYHQAATLRLP